METRSRRSTRSPRSLGFDLHTHAAHSDHLSPKKVKMASPRSFPSSPAATGAAESTNAIAEPQAVSRKSSLAFILRGGEGKQEDEQEAEQIHEDEESESEGEAYRQGQKHSDSYQQEYINRNSSYESQGYSSQYIRHYELEQQHRPQQLYHHQQQYQQQCQQFQQHRYPVSPPAAAFSASQRVPRPSFPLEPRTEPSLHSAQVENGKWAETQPRKKGSKFCIVPGCISRAKHARLCWKHGGSVKCKVPTCSNRAKSKGVCWSHGGGTICSFDDCSTISVSNGVCWAHGGGKRCVVEGCGRPSYERTGNLCSVHFAESVV